MNLKLRIANYISRYAPSRKKISAYLTKKKCLHIEAFLSDIGYDESLMCDLWMKTFMSLWKWEKDIRFKLMRKEFPKELIEMKIDLFDEQIRDWSEHKAKITNQIQILLKWWKSKMIIYQKLFREYPYFKSQIEDLLEDTSDDEGLWREVAKYRNKYNLALPKEKQKFYSALMRKGFLYDEIRTFVGRKM